VSGYRRHIIGSILICVLHLLVKRPEVHHITDNKTAVNTDKSTSGIGAPIYLPIEARVNDVIYDLRRGIYSRRRMQKTAHLNECMTQTFRAKEKKCLNDDKII